MQVIPPPVIPPRDSFTPEASLRPFPAKGLLLLLFLISLALRIYAAPDFVIDRDGIYFLKGLERYSVVEVRPHWPGYPVYILFGRLFHWVIPDPLNALTWLSILSSSLSILPIVSTTRMLGEGCGLSRHRADRAGLLAGAVWTGVPLGVLEGTHVFSDPLGLLCGLCMGWASVRALFVTSPMRPALVAFALGGLLPGIRLSLVALLPMLLPLVVVLRRRKRETGHSSWPAISGTTSGWASLGVAFVLPIVGWLGFQIYQDGQALLQAGHEHLIGHFTRHGNAALHSTESLGQRLVHWLSTLGIQSLGGGSFGQTTYGQTLFGQTIFERNFGLVILRTGISILWILALWAGFRVLWRSPSRQPLVWVLCAVVPYGLFVFVIHDWRLPRYLLPTVALLCMLAGLGLSLRSWATSLALPLLLVVLVLPLAAVHHISAPVEQQAHAYVNNRIVQGLATARSSVLMTPDWFRVLPALSHDFRILANPEPNRIPTLTRALARQGVTLMAVDSLVTSGDNVLPGWIPEVWLCRSPLFLTREPSELLLYRYAPGQPARVIPTCSTQFQARSGD